MRSLMALLLLTCASTALGQHGPRIGIGMATQGPGTFGGSTANMLPGLLAGWHAEAKLHPQMSLVPEVLWMSKGSYVRNPAQGASTLLLLRYVEVPILLKISTDRKPEGMFLLGGFSLGWFIRGQERRWLNGNLVWDEPYRLADTQRRSQLSLNLGAGMESRRWTFDVRGMSSISPFDPLVRLQNQVYALTVAYRMGNPPPEPPTPTED